MGHAARRGVAERQGGAATVLIFVLAIAATALTYHAVRNRCDQELHQAVVKKLTSLFPGTNVYVGHVARNASGSVVASDVCLAMRGTRPRLPVFHAQRMVIQGDLEISDWVAHTVAVRQVDIFGAQVDVWPLDQHRWSMEALIPHTDPTVVTPHIRFHDAMLRLRAAAAPDANNVSVHHISGHLRPRQIASAGQTPAAYVEAKLSGGNSELVKLFDLTAMFDKHQKTWWAKGDVQRLRLTKELHRRLPPQLSQHLSQLSALECYASAAFEVHSAQDRPQFKVRGQLSGGHLQDPRLPYPLENLHGDFSCDSSQIQLRNMRASSGKIRFELNADLQGFGLDSPMTVIAKVHHLDLDQRLKQALPTNLQQQWDKLQLAGQVSGRVGLDFDGQRWTPNLSVYCEDVRIKPWIFPYPLIGIQGHVSYQGAHLSSPHLTGQAGGQTVVGCFSLDQTDQGWTGWLNSEVQGPVSIDEQLISALTPRGASPTGGEQFVRRLRPSGTIKLTQAAFYRDSPDAAWKRDIDANVYNGSLRYEGFEYPIYDIRGRIVGHDDDWSLDRFEGRNDSGRIMCSGNWRTVRSGSVPMKLQFDALSIPIEEELKHALPAETQFVWNELRPSGSIDSVSVTMERATPHTPLTTSVQIVEDSQSNAASGRSLRIHPKTFPYRLNDVDCRVAYSPGLVKIYEATGHNGASRLSLTGTCRPTEDGRWQASVEWLPQTRLIVESELLRALPPSIRESLVRIDFRGALSVLGKSQIVFANQFNSKLETAWDCQVAVESGQLGDGKHIGAMRGTVWMQGHSDGDRVNASGSMMMDALTVRGIPVTRLSGPFALLDSQLYFGSRVSEVLPEADQTPTPDLRGGALSGRLALSGQGRLDSGKFYVQAGLDSADLSLLLKDLGVESKSTEATCNMELDFNGIPWNPQTYDGHGRIQLRDAQLYQLPFMIRLMRVASVNASNDSAFQTADIKFQIDGDRIPLQIACDGDVLRLRGEGWTNLRREVDLDLFSYVGRRIPIAQVVSPLLAESRYATFMLIEVRGTLDNPTMQRRAFPQLEATFQQIFPEIAEKRESDPLLPWRK